MAMYIIRLQEAKILIRSHIYSNDIGLETFGYVLPHNFETKFLKIMIVQRLKMGQMRHKIYFAFRKCFKHE